MDVVESKPLLRGWSHALAAVGAVGTSLALCLQSRDDLPRLLSLLVYGLSMCQVFAVSALYHLGSWSQPWRARLRALDHASIFALIAGTYTPIAFNVLAGWERPVVLGAVWAQALAGMALVTGSVRLPRYVGVLLYLGMGWAALLAAPSLVRNLPWPAVAAFVLGGLLYTLGALVYAFRRPDPLPRVFGFHEVFHALTIGASSAFTAAIWSWVLPFPRD